MMNIINREIKISKKSFLQANDLESFLQVYDLTSLIKEPIYFQLTNPTWIDLILTNQKNKYKFSNGLDCLITTN